MYIATWLSTITRVNRIAAICRPCSITVIKISLPIMKCTIALVLCRCSAALHYPASFALIMSAKSLYITMIQIYTKNEENRIQILASRDRFCNSFTCRSSSANCFTSNPTKCNLWNRPVRSQLVVLFSLRFDHTLTRLEACRAPAMTGADTTVGNQDQRGILA